jgi:rod shape determining protein RodA
MFDWVLYGLVLILLSISIILIYTITFGNQVNLALRQGIFAGIGLVFMFFLSMTDFRFIKNWTTLIYILGIISLVLVFLFGYTQFGARRWINFGFFPFQPSEIFKLIIIIALAKFFSSKTDLFNIKSLINVLVIVLIPIVMVMRQPDLGTAIVLAVTAFGMLFAVKLPKKLILIVFASLIIALPLVFLSLKDYQKHRIEVFLNPNSDPAGTGYNITQAKIAVGSGGLYGKGLGKGSQSELNFLPVAHTDFIFAGLAEVSGFVGSVMIILIYIIMLWRIVGIANSAPDDFSSMLALGIGILFLFQIFVNIGMNIGIMPVVGIPLPFVSSGGTSLMTSLIAIGILQSIYRQKENTKRY